MALHKITDFDPNYRFSDRDIMGFNIYDGAEVVGSVDDILVDDEGQFRYIVMFMGRFLAGKRVLLPFGLAQVAHDDRCLYADGLSHEQIEALPEYDRTKLIDEDYEDQVNSIYSSSTSRMLKAPNLDNSTMVQAGVASADFNTASPDTNLNATTAMPIGTPTSDLDSSTTNIYQTDAHDMSMMNAIDTTPVATADLDQVNAADIDTTPTVDMGTANIVGTDVGTEATNTAAIGNPEALESKTIDLYEEQLVADKSRQKTGEVILGKRVETEAAHASVPIEKERIIVEEFAPDDFETPVTPGADAFQDGAVAQMEVYEETPDIHKEAFVREQVNVKKEIDHDVVEADEQIRRERLDLQTEGQATIERHSDAALDERL